MRIYGQHLCTFYSVGLTSFVNIFCCHFHINLSFTLADFCLPIDVEILHGNISLSSSITLCSHVLLLIFWSHVEAVFISSNFSLVAPIMATFDMVLEELKIFLTTFITYRTPVNLTIYPPYRFIFTVSFSSHFIFWPFLTVT